jgi:hypothetical protein
LYFVFDESDSLSLSSFCRTLRKIFGQFLNRNIQERMSFVKKVKEHNFFKEIDWEKLEKQQIKSPYKPKPTLTLDISDTIVLNTPSVDDFIGYTFAESRTLKKRDNEAQQ